MVGVSKIYNVGIIGYGGMAGNHRAQLEKGEVRAKLKGVFDIDKARLDVAKEQGYVAYSSKEELLADKEIDVVVIGATNEVHKDLSIEALRAGKHVICEKPVTLSSAELEEIIAVSKECNKIFTVDQNRRVNRDFISMWRAIDKGLVGKPYVIESRVEGSRGLPKGWREKKAQGGGMMYDWGVHLIDQIMYMIPEKVVNVYCKMFCVNYPEVDDNFRLTFTFESGLVAHIEVSTNSFIKHDRFYVLGTEGTMVVNEWDGTGKVVRKIKNDNEWETEIKKVKAGPSKTMAPRDESTVEVIELTEPKDVVDNLNPIYEQLIDAIEGKELKVKPEQALRVVKVMEAAFKSAETGNTIKCMI